MRSTPLQKVWQLVTAAIILVVPAWINQHKGTEHHHSLTGHVHTHVDLNHGHDHSQTGHDHDGHEPHHSQDHELTPSLVKKVEVFVCQAVPSLNSLQWTNLNVQEADVGWVSSDRPLTQFLAHKQSGSRAPPYSFFV